MYGTMSVVLSVLLALTSCFLIFLILLQRGRGGGLAGAFGGMGGQSAFGTKAGDIFTRITIIAAVIWVALAGVNGCVMWKASEGLFQGGSNVPEEVSAPEDGAAEQGDKTSSPGDGFDGLNILDPDSTQPPSSDPSHETDEKSGTSGAEPPAPTDSSKQ